MCYCKIHREIAGAYRGLVDKMISTLIFNKKYSTKLHGLLELNPMAKMYSAYTSRNYHDIMSYPLCNMTISIMKGSHCVQPPNQHFHKINGTQRRTLVSS